MKSTTVRAWTAAAAAMLALATPAAATLTGDRYEVQARLSMQNTFHHDAGESIDWVQQRNEFRFDIKYNLMEYGKPIGLLTGARFNMLYRARYDGIFDIRDSYGRRGYDRDDFRFPEGKIPRELFFDLDFGGPFRGLSARIGRQQVVWGEADVFRSIDIVNPLRIDQNGLLGEDLADYREPLWIAKFLYDIGSLGPINNAGLEFFYSPNGRPSTERVLIGEAFRIGVDTNNPLHGFNRNNFLPFDQVRHPWELQRVGPYYGEAGQEADLGLLGKSDFVYLTSSNTPTSTFDFRGSMAGIRFLGTTFGGIDFTLNYIFKRADIPGTALVGDALFNPAISTNGVIPNMRPELVTQALAAAVIPDLNGNGIGDGTEDLIRRCVDDKEPLFLPIAMHGSSNLLTGCQPTPFWYPWQHIIGATATYNDYAYTGAVFRSEVSYNTKEPRNGRPPLAGPRAGNFPTERDFATNAMRQTDVLRTMFGFDYLRSFGLVAARSWPQPFRSLFGQDQWLVSGQFFNEYYAHSENQIGLTDSVTDRQYKFNPVITMLASGFFVNQRLRPLFVVAYDVNLSTPVVQLQTEYYIGTRWAIRVGDILYLGSKHDESFLYFHKYADRDTLFLRLTYFLL